jgi:hypothetical protein
MRNMFFTCSMTTLIRERLRYLSNKTNLQVLAETDPTTKLILEEIGKLEAKLLNGEGNKITITPEDFKCFWKKVNEFTLSSMSGVHYSHYKATIQDRLSTEILAQQLTVIAQSRIPPESWSVGL